MSIENVDIPVTQTPPVPEPSSREHLESIYDSIISKADAAETAAATTPAPDGTSTTPVDTDQPPSETTTAAPTPTPAPEKVDVSPDRLADSAYWGGLDKDGWLRMERDYPVETKLVKSAQAAATRIVNAARNQTPAPPSTEPSTQPPADINQPSPELIAAVEESQSLDPVEAARGYMKVQRLTAPSVLRELGIDPERSRADALVATAYQTAVAELPELSTFTPQDLDAAVESSRPLMALVRIGTPEAIAEAMIGAGQILSERKRVSAATEAANRKAADDKKKDLQRVVQSNARPASADALAPGGATSTKQTFREQMSDKYDRIVPTILK